ncbi:MAG: FHA domain-containing protein [Uliginosibacterium sp.]|nr:FHA domain-containing protein [Uliginosibacterium sp.]
MTILPPTHIALTIRHTQDKLPVREVLLDEEGGTLGRAPANTIALTGDANVSLVHATLELIGSRWVLKDIGDLVPVMRNGRPLGFGRRCDIGEGDEFSIASFNLRVSLDPARFASIASDSTSGPQATALAGLPASPPPTLPPVALPQSASSFTPVQTARPMQPSSIAISASELQRLHQDPFAQSAQHNNARNFVGSDEHLLDGVLPKIQQNHASALANPLHREANLDPLRHRSESIDALFSLEAGQGIDPLADVLGALTPRLFSDKQRRRPHHGGAKPATRRRANQVGSARPGSNDFETSIKLPNTGQ